MARTTWQPIRILGKGPWSLLPAQTWSVLTDFFIFAAGLSVFYAVVVLARTWFGPFNPHVEISQNPRMLPVYAAYSLLRISVAYVLSLAFTLVYGYIAAYNARAERIMIPLLDILQSIPVLSFLPGVMLAMVALFPNHQIGVELGAILLIFTGQVWNMAFSFYSSLKSIPREMREAAKIYRFNWYQRFTQIEAPYAAIGLVWNSMMSVAGGWFFLMACEMFVLGSKDFRLPGLGSYLQTAASAGDRRSILWTDFPWPGADGADGHRLNAHSYEIKIPSATEIMVPKTAAGMPAGPGNISGPFLARAAPICQFVSRRIGRLQAMVRSFACRRWDKFQPLINRPLVIRRPKAPGSGTGLAV